MCLQVIDSVIEEQESFEVPLDYGTTHYIKKEKTSY